MTDAQQLATDLDVLQNWIQGRDALLDRVLFFTKGACNDLSHNDRLLRLGAQNRFFGQAANQLALGIRWIRTGREDPVGYQDRLDSAEPLAAAVEELAGNGVDPWDSTISEREKKRRHRAYWRRKELATSLRIESAILAHTLAGQSTATFSHTSEFLGHLAAAHRALLAADPEKTAYELGHASQCLWRATDFQLVRKKTAGHSDLWMEGEAESWEKHVAAHPSYESLQSHGMNPELPPGVGVVGGEIVFLGWRWVVGFLTWPLVALVVGIGLGYWLSR